MDESVPAAHLCSSQMECDVLAAPVIAGCVRTVKTKPRPRRLRTIGPQVVQGPPRPETDEERRGGGKVYTQTSDFRM
uniref:Uncharacterized protein n=1 Tax=Knipowitschia caucasica TaxID=637954 RepID=A0AAV2LE82_KNICA